MSTDKAGKSYWEQNWRNRDVPGAVNPADNTLANHVNLKLHELFSHCFSGDRRTEKLLEVGCARSAWLPYFDKEFGFEVSGLDYSEVGCWQAEQVLLNESVEGHVFHADLFSPPGHLLESFDAVVSFGVAEHFEDTAACISAFSSFLKPGGTMITTIPNLTGMLGTLQKFINRQAFDVHVPLDRDALRESHEKAGLEVSSCEYFLSGSFTIINLENFRDKSVYGTAVRLRSLASKAAWSLDRRVPGFKPNRLTSPYVVCVAKKP